MDKAESIKKIIKTLKDRKLLYLIPSFKNMIELDKKEFKISYELWDRILEIVLIKKSTDEIEHFFLRLFDELKIFVKEKPTYKNEKSTNRVKVHRQLMKDYGCRNLSFKVSNYDYLIFKQYKLHFGLTYQDAFLKIFSLVDYDLKKELEREFLIDNGYSHILNEDFCDDDFIYEIITSL